MKRVKGICISTILMMGLVLGACGNSESGKQPSSGSGEAALENTGGNQNMSNEDMADITMAFFTAMEPNSDRLQDVEDAINAISEREINVHVNLLPLGMGSYDQQVNLMIAGNEDLDLMATFFAGSTAFNSM